ncbi:MAG: hypothetical protein HJJLKODD_00495 [Phycisphaerae bacterium]|nr:hypothetical protein [Phycisphaerae bacterium]
MQTIGRPTVITAGALLMILLGCQSTSTPPYDATTQRAMLETILTNQVRLVSAMTQPKSFDTDALPDGIEAVIQAFDPQGEPAKLTGQLTFELYTYRPAAADPKGTLLQSWNYAVASDQDQRGYWNRRLRAYEFPLRIDPQHLTTETQYVLLVRHNNLWNEHNTDQTVLDFAEYIARLRGQITATNRNE